MGSRMSHLLPKVPSVCFDALVHDLAPAPLVKKKRCFCVASSRTERRSMWRASTSSRSSRSTPPAVATRSRSRPSPTLWTAPPLPASAGASEGSAQHKTTVHETNARPRPLERTRTQESKLERKRGSSETETRALYMVVLYKLFMAAAAQNLAYICCAISFLENKTDKASPHVFGFPWTGRDF